MKDWRDISYLASGNARQHAAFEAIQTLGILGKLSEFDPVLVSTVCLAIDTPASDLDIICSVPDPARFEALLRTEFSACEAFDCRARADMVANRIVCSFRFQGFEFEIYGSQVTAERNRAFRHFVQIDRLLRAYGEPLRERIRSAKLAGMKTVPAVAAILGLPGDPYEAVLKLEALADEDMPRPPP